MGELIDGSFGLGKPVLSLLKAAAGKTEPGQGLVRNEDKLSNVATQFNNFQRSALECCSE